MNSNFNVNLDDFYNKMDKDLLVKKPRKITFVSAKNEIMNASVSIEVMDGDVAGIIRMVVERGGIFGKNPDKGEYFFIPWPCAIVTITN